MTLRHLTWRRLGAFAAGSLLAAAAARHAEMIDSGVSYIGFRCVIREH